MKAKSIIFWIGAVLAGILIFLTGGKSNKVKVQKIKARVARRKNNITSLNKEIGKTFNKIESGVGDRKKEEVKIKEINRKREDLKKKLIEDSKAAENLNDDQIASDIGSFLSGGF